MTPSLLTAAREFLTLKAGYPSIDASEEDWAAYMDRCETAREQLAAAVAALDSLHPGVPGRPIAETLGRLVRGIWVQWASEQPNPKPSWLAPWEQLLPGDQEVDMRIGLGVAAVVASGGEDHATLRAVRESMVAAMRELADQLTPPANRAFRQLGAAVKEIDTALGERKDGQLR